MPVLLDALCSVFSRQSESGPPSVRKAFSPEETPASFRTLEPTSLQTNHSIDLLLGSLLPPPFLPRASAYPCGGRFLAIVSVDKADLVGIDQPGVDQVKLFRDAEPGGTELRCVGCAAVLCTAVLPAAL